MEYKCLNWWTSSFKLNVLGVIDNFILYLGWKILHTWNTWVNRPRANKMGGQRYLGQTASGACKFWANGLPFIQLGDIAFYISNQSCFFSLSKSYFINIQFLQVTNPDLVKEKSRESGQLMRGKSQDGLDRVTSFPEKPELNVPLVEALFLPDFPIKGDAEGQEFEVYLRNDLNIFYCKWKQMV